MESSTRSENAALSGLLVKYTTWGKNKADIVDPTASVPGILYTMELHLTKPHIRVGVPTEGTTIATANIHVLSTKFDLEVRGQSFQMKPESALSQKIYVFDSPALGGYKLSWNAIESSSGMKMTCLDAQGGQLGQLKTDPADAESAGEVQISGIAVQKRDLREEIIVTALTIFYLYRRRTRGATAAASNSAAAAASVSSAIAAT